MKYSVVSVDGGEEQRWNGIKQFAQIEDVESVESERLMGARCLQLSGGK